MSAGLLILRPEPGASETAARAVELGLRPVAAPIFTVRALPWEAPDPALFDALVLTSANAPRLAGAGLARFLHLPCLAVGEATAAAARAAGFADVRPGSAGAAELFATAGGARLLHLCGREHGPAAPAGGSLARIAVYAADPVGRLPEPARGALALGALALAHSPRAAAHFARLLDEAGLPRGGVALALISEAAAAAAGGGWKLKAVAARPRDDALLELAAKLCQTGAMARPDRGG